MIFIKNLIKYFYIKNIVKIYINKICDYCTSKPKLKTIKRKTLKKLDSKSLLYRQNLLLNGLVL